MLHGEQTRPTAFTSAISNTSSGATGQTIMYEVVGTQFRYMDGERWDGSGGMDSWKRLQQCVWRSLVHPQENHLYTTTRRMVTRIPRCFILHRSWLMGLYLTGVIDCMWK